MNHVKGGSLFRHEEHSLAVGSGTADDVRDRLRLSRARRPLHDKVAPRSSGGNDLGLRRIGIEDVSEFLWIGEALVEVLVRRDDTGTRLGTTYQQSV